MAVDVQLKDQLPYSSVVSGLPGLVVCMSACHAADHGSKPTTDNFFKAIRSRKLHPVCPELEKGVSGWQLVICCVPECW